jgi:hypothetical protein
MPHMHMAQGMQGQNQDSRHCASVRAADPRTMVHKLPAAGHIPLGHGAIKGCLILLALGFLVAYRSYCCQLIRHILV